MASLISTASPTPSAFPSTLARPGGLPSALAELQARGQAEASRQFLQVHLYRVRRRLALRLPLQALPKPPSQVGVIQGYPWSIWILWQIEARMLGLGVAADREPQGKATQIFHRDFSGLLEWNPQEVSKDHGLAGAHLLRCVSYLISRNLAAGETAQSFLHALITAHRPHLDRQWSTLQEEKTTGTTWPKPYYNIYCILPFALALAARTISHPMLEEIEALTEETLMMLAEARRTGWTEGWSYDAYVQDFLADWLLARASTGDAGSVDLAGVYDALRPSLLEPLHLTCPGEEFLPPLLGDSECPEMFFHWSAAAKWYALMTDPALLELLKHADFAQVSSDALLWWPKIPRLESRSRGGESATVTPNAIVLASGTARDDIKVTIGAARCQNGHQQADRGHVSIGSGSHWIVQDPGYRQYLRNSEHTFATGAIAHNCPVIDGQGLALEGVRQVLLDWEAPAIEAAQAAVFQLARLYPADLELTDVTRRVRLSDGVLVEDTVRGKDSHVLSYSWHFHPEACVGEESGDLLVVAGQQAWIVQCNQIPLSLDLVSRLRGSRGQQTLSASFTIAGETTVCWRFLKA